MYVWSEAHCSITAEWKYIIKGLGVRFAERAGAKKIHQWLAESWVLINHYLLEMQVTALALRCRYS